MATPILFNTTMTLTRRTLTVSRGRVTGVATVDTTGIKASVQVDERGRNTKTDTAGHRQRDSVKAFVQTGTGARGADQFGEDAADHVAFSSLPGEVYRVMSVKEYTSDLAGSVTMPHELLRCRRIDEGDKETP